MCETVPGLTTAYADSNPFTNSTFIGLFDPNPDTGFAEVTNNGSSTFMGRIIAVANSPSTPFKNVFKHIPLAPGASVSLNVSDEGSNQGGFNYSSHLGLDKGVSLSLRGPVVDNFGNSMLVDLKALDKNIHSGVPRNSPCDAVITDACVLQGGSPTGCDNGDDYEISQAWGYIDFNNTDHAYK
jgi:hypothetical protein